MPRRSTKSLAEEIIAQNDVITPHEIEALPTVSAPMVAVGEIAVPVEEDEEVELTGLEDGLFSMPLRPDRNPTQFTAEEIYEALVARAGLWAQAFSWYG